MIIVVKLFCKVNQLIKKRKKYSNIFLNSLISSQLKTYSSNDHYVAKPDKTIGSLALIDLAPGKFAFLSIMRIAC
jgi:hypothetical protein